MYYYVTPTFFKRILDTQRKGGVFKFFHHLGYFFKIVLVSPQKTCRFRLKKCCSHFFIISPRKETHIIFFLPQEKQGQSTMQRNSEAAETQYRFTSWNVDSVDVTETLSNNRRLVSLPHDHILAFKDCTYGTLKKMKLRPTYYSDGAVEQDENLDTACIDGNSIVVSVVVPTIQFFEDGNDEDDIGLVYELGCSDCANIARVAKTSFLTGEQIEGEDSAVTYLFNFGQKVKNDNDDEVGIVVGQTRQFLYLLTMASIKSDVQRGVAVKPRRRKAEHFRAMVFTKALNFDVVVECAKMEDYVVPEETVQTELLFI